MGATLRIYKRGNQDESLVWMPRSGIFTAVLSRLAEITSNAALQEGLLEGANNPLPFLDMTEWSAEMMNDLLRAIVILEAEISQDAESASEGLRGKFELADIVDLRNAVYLDHRTDMEIFDFAFGKFVMGTDNTLECPNWVFDYVMVYVLRYCAVAGRSDAYTMFQQARRVGLLDLTRLDVVYLELLIKPLDVAAFLFQPGLVVILYSRQYLDHLNPFIGRLYEAFQSAFPKFFEEE